MFNSVLTLKISKAKKYILIVYMKTMKNKSLKNLDFKCDFECYYFETNWWFTVSKVLYEYRLLKCSQ